MGASRIAATAFLCLALPGCQTTLYGNQSTGGGTSSTTSAGQVSGSAKFSGGRVSFSSGQPVSPNAQGGFVKLSGSAAGILIGGLVLADLLYYIVGPSQPKALVPEASIADTCSCYKKDSDR